MQTNNICPHCHSKNLVFHTDKTEHTCFFCGKGFSTPPEASASIKKSIDTLSFNSLESNQLSEISQVSKPVETVMHSNLDTSSLSNSTSNKHSAFTSFPIFVQPNTHDGEFKSNFEMVYYPQFELLEMFEEYEDPDSLIQKLENEQTKLKVEALTQGARSRKEFIDKLLPTRKVFQTYTLFTQAGISYLTELQENNAPFPTWNFTFYNNWFTCIEKANAQTQEWSSLELGQMHSYGPLSLQLRMKLSGKIANASPSQLPSNSLTLDSVQLMLFHSQAVALIYLTIGKGPTRVFLGEVNSNEAYEGIKLPHGFQLDQYFTRFHCQSCSSIFVQPKTFYKNKQEHDFRPFCFACGNGVSLQLSLQNINKMHSDLIGRPIIEVKDSGKIEKFYMAHLELHVHKVIAANRSSNHSGHSLEFMGLQSIYWSLVADPMQSFSSRILLNDQNFKLLAQENWPQEQENGVIFGNTLFDKIAVFECSLQSVDGILLQPFALNDPITITLYRLQSLNVISIKTRHTMYFYSLLPLETMMLEHINENQVVTQIEYSAYKINLLQNYSSVIDYQRTGDILNQLVKDPLTPIQYYYEDNFFNDMIEAADQETDLVTYINETADNALTRYKVISIFIMFIVSVIGLIVMTKMK